MSVLHSTIFDSIRFDRIISTSTSTFTERERDEPTTNNDKDRHRVERFLQIFFLIELDRVNERPALLLSLSNEEGNERCELKSSQGVQEDEAKVVDQHSLSLLLHIHIVRRHVEFNMSDLIVQSPMFMRTSSRMSFTVRFRVVFGLLWRKALWLSLFRRRMMCH